MLAGDQRAHLVVGLTGRTDLDRRNAGLDLVDQFVGDRLAGEHDRDGHASLAGRTVRGADRGVGRHVEIGVGQHQHVVLRPAECLHTLAVLRARLVDVPGDRRRADEADGSNVGVLEDAIDGDLVAVDDVEAAVGKPGLLQQVADQHAGRGILLARLEDEGVAAREGVGEHPHRHHAREVERGDAGHDAERLLDAVHIDPGAGLLAVSALHEVGDAAGELDVLEAAGHFAERVAEHLAVLHADQRGDLFAVGVDQFAHVEHHLGSPRQVGRPPRRERGLGHRDGVVDLCCGGEVNGGLLLTSSRIPNHPRPPGSAQQNLPINPMRNPVHFFPSSFRDRRQGGHRRCVQLMHL